MSIFNRQPGEERRGMRPEVAMALQTFGSGLVNLGNNQPVDMSAGMQAIQAHKKDAAWGDTLASMNGGTGNPQLDAILADPKNRKVLASMPPAVAQKVLMQAMMTPPDPYASMSAAQLGLTGEQAAYFDRLPPAARPAAVAQLTKNRFAPPPKPDRTANIKEFLFARPNGTAAEFEAWMAEKNASGGVNINNVGSIPQGYEIIQDPVTGATRMQPIPGGPAAMDAENAARQAETSAESNQQKNTILMSALDQAESVLDNASTVNPATGLGAGLMSNFGGTASTDYREAIKPVLSGVALGELRRLKESSPSGASGFGALSEKELALLEGAIASLENSQSEPQLRANLKRVRDIYEGMMEKAFGASIVPGGVPAGWTQPPEAWAAMPDSFKKEWLEIQAQIDGIGQ